MIRTTLFAGFAALALSLLSVAGVYGGAYHGLTQGYASGFDAGHSDGIAYERAHPSEQPSPNLADLWIAAECEQAKGTGAKACNWLRYGGHLDDQGGGVLDYWITITMPSGAPRSFPLTVYVDSSGEVYNVE